MVDITEKQSFSFRRLLFGSIRNKLLLGFILVILLALATGLYIIFQSQASLQKTIGQSSVDISQNTLDSIDRITHRRLERWQEFADVNEFLKKTLTASNSEFDEMSDKENYISSQDKDWIDSKNITPFMLDLINNDLSKMLRERTSFYENSTGYNIFPEAFITNKYGAIVALTGKTSDYNQADEDWWQNAKNRGYFVSDVNYDESSKIYSLEISIKIEDNEGNFIGVLKVIYSIDEIIGIMKNVVISLSDQGHVDFSLINKNGDIIYSTHEFTILQKSPPEIIELMDKGGYILKEHRGQKELLAISGSRGYLNYKGNDWHLVIEYPEEEIFAPVYKLRNNLILITCIATIFILLLVIFTSRKITKPITELSEATKKIQNKDFRVRVKFNSGDELEELGRSFNKTAEVLENLEKEKNQVDKAKTEFLSITSHELRSPMTPMKAQLQMVLGDYFGKLNKEQRESLQIVLSNTERLDKIIVDFLEISRIEAARLKFNFIKADLTKTIESVVEEMKGFMPEKKIKIETHVEKLPVIEVDPDRVSQVLRNLINNAIKFTSENGIIQITAKVHSGMILFSVKDSGIGIAEKDQRRLFEPFYQVDNMYQHKSGGTGLGLAISRGIVESQNGKIWLNSLPGKGTTFYFTIPLKPVREIKAIKLLFSEAAQSEENIKNIFKTYIGPLGDKEFEGLRESHGINGSSVKEYIDFLIKEGIIKSSSGEEFKNEVLLTLGVKKEIKKDNDNISKVDLSDLKKQGLIK